MAVTAVGKDMVRDAKYFRLACRIFAELGAQYVKTYYVEEDFETVTASCPVPIVMAGGKKLPELDALTMAYNAVQQGASGVDMGRNIFQSDAPKAMIEAVARGRAQERQARRGARLVPIAQGRRGDHFAQVGRVSAMTRRLRPPDHAGRYGSRRSTRICGGDGEHDLALLVAGLDLGDERCRDRDATYRSIFWPARARYSMRVADNIGLYQARSRKPGDGPYVAIATPLRTCRLVGRLAAR